LIYQARSRLLQSGFDKSNPYGRRWRISICFYQHESGRSALERLKREIGAGYIRSLIVLAPDLPDYPDCQEKSVRSGAKKQSAPVIHFIVLRCCQMWYIGARVMQPVIYAN
jgi:hypothetical protein